MLRIPMDAGARIAMSLTAAWLSTKAFGLAMTKLAVLRIFTKHALAENRLAGMLGRHDCAHPFPQTSATAFG